MRFGARLISGFKTCHFDFCERYGNAQNCSSKNDAINRYLQLGYMQVSQRAVCEAWMYVSSYYRAVHSIGIFSKIFPDYRKCDESDYLLLFSARISYLIGNVYKWVPNKVGAYTWDLVTCGNGMCMQPNLRLT